MTGTTDNATIMDVLRKSIARPAIMLEIMRKYDLKIDNLDDPMQKLALTFYTELCQQASDAEAALSAPDTQAGALWTLGRELIEWAAQHWQTGWGTCCYCEIYGNGEHKPDCLHIRAKAAVEAAKGEPK